MSSTSHLDYAAGMKRTKLIARRVTAKVLRASAKLAPQDSAQVAAIAAQIRRDARAGAARSTEVLLFAGESRTLAAEALATELGLDLVRVDLSRVIGKSIGETEKNLDRIFDAADKGAVLLFDEAETLFGKRTEVNDSHDRYANIAAALLLQRLEASRGVTILATSLRQNIDAAFQRRLRMYAFLPKPTA
jgi:AAA+ superfamily predicted ATPase